jgi:eukaryotic-like serine/threonine-protein kinase
MMTGVSSAATSAPGHAVHTLRQIIEHHKSSRTPISFVAALDIVVPLCGAVADIHQQGFGLYVYPSNLTLGPRGYTVSSELAARPPELREDRACMPPEASPNQLGNQSTSVYSIGAILYELLTGMSVGPTMLRPTEVVPSLPQAIELILAKALIRDAAHRPSDLRALAQALYGLSPKPTIPPPPEADARHMDEIDGLEIDIKLSMLPPPVMAAPNSVGGPRSFPGSAPGSAPVVPLASSARGAAGPQSGPRSAADPATAHLAALKARLEADPTPRYVVIKDGMDHGPFNAVELLQQIRTNAFTQDDVLQNTETKEERPISAWPDFAPFADTASKHKAIIAEKAAVHAGVAKESKRTRDKLMLGLVLVGVLLAGAGVWFYSQAGTRSDEIAIQTEAVSNIEAEGAVKSDKKGGGAKGSRVIGSAGGLPQLAGGQSCEGAQAAYVEEIKMAGGGQADITRGQYSGIMNSGAYFSHCGVPSNVGVNICVAVQGGRAVGVTVNTTPNHGSKACITAAVRKLSFPSHPKLDVVRVNFAAE